MKIETQHTSSSNLPERVVDMAMLDGSLKFIL